MLERRFRFERIGGSSDGDAAVVGKVELVDLLLLGPVVPSNSSLKLKEDL